MIAGMIEKGESPEAALRREVEEELGYRADRVEHIRPSMFLRAARRSVSGSITSR